MKIEANPFMPEAVAIQKNDSAQKTKNLRRMVKLLVENDKKIIKQSNKHLEKQEKN